MIDTLRLYLTDYSISENCELIVQPSSINMSTGKPIADFPLWQVNGEIIKGAKAYFNSEHFNFSINSRSRQQPGNVGATVQFSIPKVVNGNNYAQASKKESIAAIKSIERGLSDVGIRTNLNKALVSRVDTFRNIVAEESFSSYSAVFQMLEGKRMQRRDYGTTFLWGNTQQEICVYDKIKQMTIHKMSTQNLPSNTIRFEHRLLNAKKVQTALSGIRSLSDLFDGYDVLCGNFKCAMHSHLFQHEVAENEMITVGALEEDMRRFAAEHKRNWFAKYLHDLGVNYLLQLTDIETVREVLTKVSQNRQKAWRIAGEMKQLQMQAMQMKTVAPSIRPLSALYNELRLKVLS